MTGRGEPAARALWLLRHAKAAEPAGGAGDHDRPLTTRGRRDAAALGRRLCELAPPGTAPPDAVLCSTATRTTETAAGVIGDRAIEVDRRRSLYDGGPNEVLAEVRTMDDGVRSLLVVGHNPTTHAMAVGLLGDEGPDRERLGRFPTCALAIVRLPAGRWGEVAWGTGTLAGFFTPPY